MNTVVQDKEVFGRITTRSAPSTRALRDIDPSDPFSLHDDRVPDLADFYLFSFSGVLSDIDILQLVTLKIYWTKERCSSNF